MTEKKKSSSIAACLEGIKPCHSRIHRMRSLRAYVKREDELGFGISGTKLRKYLSLLPAILQEKPDAAVLIGSAYSNHVLSFAQLLKENGIEPLLFLLGDEKCKMQGNLLYSTLIATKKNIHWISRSRWHDIDQIAEQFVKERADKKIIVVPKGANCPAALPGALTLPLDILRNEEEHNLAFDHIFIDSGTGMTAIALLLALAYLERNTFVHIVQISGNPEEFHGLLRERKKDFEHLLGEAVLSPSRFQLYSPSTAAAFGAVNSTIFQTVAHVAKEEGFLTDPVFTAKLFYEGKKIIQHQGLTGNILFIHSGGGLGLTGFQEELLRFLT